MALNPTGTLGLFVNGMITVMFAKFAMNDIPHAAGIAYTGETPTLATNREKIASLHWKEVLKYCHTVEDLKRIAENRGTIKMYHGAPTEYAEELVQRGPRASYNVEDTARYVANLYGISWRAFYRWAYRRHEVVEKLSTATAPVAVRWAWSFPLGEVLTDLNAHARMYVAFKEKSVREKITLDEAYDRLSNEAIEISRKTGQPYNTESAPDLLGLPDKLALKSKTGALVEIVVPTEVVSSRMTHDAKFYLEEIKSGELPIKEALLFWNHNYIDVKVGQEDIISMRIVVRGLQKWEESLIEEMIKDKKLDAYCGVGNTDTKTFYHVTQKSNLPSIVREGLYAPAHMLTSVEKAREWRTTIEEYEPAIILVITLPETWPVSDDPLHPEGMAVVTDKHIPPKHVAVLE